MDQEEVPSVEPRTDMAAMRARLDALRRLREERAADRKAVLDIVGSTPPQ